MMWTIDTWVLACANDQQDKTIISKEFLEYIIIGDHEMPLSEEVLKEYEKKALTENKSFSSIWFGKMHLAGKVKIYFQPEEAKAARLRQRLKSGLPKSIKRFDPTDIPFVVLCFRTDDRHLISGDIGERDYSPALTGWLRKEYKICFHDLIDEKPFHISRHKCTMLSKE